MESLKYGSWAWPDGVGEGPDVTLDYSAVFRSRIDRDYRNVLGQLDNDRAAGSAHLFSHVSEWKSFEEPRLVSTCIRLFNVHDFDELSREWPICFGQHIPSLKA